MTLLERLAALPNRGPSPPETPRFDQAVAKVQSAFPEQQPVDPQDLHTLINKLDLALSNNDWSGLREGDVAVVVKAFATNSSPMPRSVQQFLWRELTQTTRTNLLGSLCEGFIASWAPRDTRVHSLARVIIKQASRLSGKFQKLFTDVPELLDVDQGATSFGRWMASQRDPYQAVLAKGIPEPHGVGFMVHAHNVWLANLPSLTEQSFIDHVFAWITPSGRSELTGDRGVAVVEKLLQPWHSRMPSAEMRTSLVERLLNAYKDPRKENESFWSRVSGDGKRVMLRWLAGRRMEAFIEVVTHAEADGGKGQWESRRRFWMGMYEQGRIDEAWVAYTKRASAYADRLFDESGDASYASYGLQGGAKKDTCLLIMQINAKIVVEGSHDFRVHIFSESDPRAPWLYESSYDVDDFILPFPHPDARVHDWPGKWMNWVREKLR